MKKKKLKKRIKKLENETDYTQFKPLVDTSKGPDTVFVTGEKIEESPTPPCETCKYKGFEVLFADSPCFGCTPGDYKAYESKEED